MQLQYLCSFPLDADIKENLGRSPPKIHDLYAQVYDILSTKAGKLEAALFKNALCWLFCAQRRLSTEAFLATISIIPEGEGHIGQISENLVLDVCNNFIVLDPYLGTFRFAHLSVKEFLEQRAGFNSHELHSLAAKACLWAIMSTYPISATETTFRELGWRSKAMPKRPDPFQHYADIYWAVHCRLAGIRRSSGVLKMALKRFLLDGDQANSNIILWINRIKSEFELQLENPRSVDHRHQRIGYLLQLADNQRQLFRLILECGESVTSVALFLARALGFEEQLHDILGEVTRETPYVGLLIRWMLGWARFSFQNLKNCVASHLLQVAVEYGSRATFNYPMSRVGHMSGVPVRVVNAAASDYVSGMEVLALLLNDQAVVSIAENFDDHVVALFLSWHGPSVTMTEEVFKAAARNKESGAKVIALLLAQLSAGVTITEEVFKIAALNGTSGDKIMAVLLDWQDQHVGRAEEEYVSGVTITEEVVKAAARNKESGAKVIALLLARLGAGVTITDEVFKAAAANDTSGKRIIVLLLDRPGAGLMITEEVVMAAAKNHNNGKQILQLLLEEQGEHFPVSEKVVSAVVKGTSEHTAALLFRQRGADIRLTDDLYNAVITSNEFKRSAVMMTLLLEEREGEVIEVAKRLQCTEIGRVENLSPQLVRFRCSDGWLYHKLARKVQ
jgi:hypothetical protein